MKKSILFLAFMLISTFAFSQSGETKKLLSEIEKEWSVDDNGNVTYVRVIELDSMSKDEIWKRALNYFTYNYSSGKSVIQTEDKETGTVVGKGLYDNVHAGISLITTMVDTWHILRIDVKEGKARIILTLTDYELEISDGKSPSTYRTTKVESEYPINQKGYSKTIMGKAFYKTHKRVMASLDNLEKAIKEGNTSSKIENSDW